MTLEGLLQTNQRIQRHFLSLISLPLLISPTQHLEPLLAVRALLPQSLPIGQPGLRRAPLLAQSLGQPTLGIEPGGAIPFVHLQLGPQERFGPDPIFLGEIVVELMLGRRQGVRMIRPQQLH